MQNIVIVGASGLGREVYLFLSALGEKDKIKGYLDPNESALNNSQIDLPILGVEDNYAPGPDEVFVIAISNSTVKQKAINVLKRRNASFRSVIHPTAQISAYSDIGTGVIIYPSVSVSCDTRIGSYSVINIGAVIGHDVSVGDYSFVGTNTVLGGWAKVGNGCYIGSNSVVAQRSMVEDGARISSTVTVFGNIKPGEVVMPVKTQRGRGGIFSR